MKRSLTPSRRAPWSSDICIVVMVIKDAIHDPSSATDRGDDHVPVDGLGHVGGLVADGVADVLDGYAVAATPLTFMMETAVWRPSCACQWPIPARLVIRLNRQLSASRLYWRPVSASPTETPQVGDTAAGPHRNPTDETAHSPGLLPRAASRLITGLSRASCRDASGLAVLMSTGRRAGLPGLSRPAARQPAAAVGCRVSRAPGGWVGQGTSHARGNGRPPGRWAPGCLVGCPACYGGRGQRAGVSFRLCSCGEAAKAALGVGCCRIARGRQGAAASR
jgi:hypothetical protein